MQKKKTKKGEGKTYKHVDATSRGQVQTNTSSTQTNQHHRGRMVRVLERLQCLFATGLTQCTIQPQKLESIPVQNRPCQIQHSRELREHNCLCVRVCFPVSIQMSHQRVQFGRGLE